MKETQSILSRVRRSVVEMAAYSSARSLYSAEDGYVFLDANECSYEPYIGSKNQSRYAGQQPARAVEALCRLYDVSKRNLILTRGADEAIDVLMRAFCEAREDSVVICPPTFPMYQQAATLQGVDLIKTPLNAVDFSFDTDGVLKSVQSNTKIVFVCSPNNPTGNLVPVSEIEKLCVELTGRSLVVVDETYIEFSKGQSVVPLIEKFENLVVLRTLSKAYAAAGLRAGVAIGNSAVIDVMKKVLAPYPVAQVVADEICKILTEANIKRLREKIAETVARRDRLVSEFLKLDDVVSIYPSEANFLLIKVKNGKDFAKRCLDGAVILRDQSAQKGLENCVRIAIGSDEDMARLFDVICGRAAQVKMGRTVQIVRNTKETAIDVRVNLDSSAPVKISTGIGFYDHMLEQIARHGGFSLTLECAGDLDIDAHHTVEDCAIALGQALKEALGDKRGIERYGFTVPMDESLASAAIDLSGRAYLKFEADFPDAQVGDLPVDMVTHVFRSLAENLGSNVHISVKGENTHHMVEACFKAFGRALGLAIRQSGGSELPSSKGVLA
ncbi:MAG: histidinol-phosphate transaminase [Alphaproteobacteria bacterium]|nr:histidinol-phosphate transaminase [Alphaproteobacteria bacterium]